MSFLSKFFTSESERFVKASRPIVDAVNALEPVTHALSNEDLREKTAVMRERLKNGESIDLLLPEAFAVVREAAMRTLGQRHYDVQIIGGLALHRRSIAEMKTGEGKTLVGTLPVYLNALLGKGVHVCTVNDYLSRRDAVWMGQVYNALGLTVGVITTEASYIYDPTHKEEDTSEDVKRDETGSFRIAYEFLRPITRSEAYAADITYGTANEFGFDYLRDNIEYDRKNLRQREHYFALVDEVDSILIDEARTPLIISAPSVESEDLYVRFAGIAKALIPTTDYTVDEKHHSIALTDAGISHAEQLLGVENIYTEGGIKYVHHLETAVRAKALYTRDKEYVVRDGQVVIVDEFTGRLQPGRRWSEGLHQAIEAKEHVPIQRESRTFASVTFQNYFRMYEKLAGMTGTAMTSVEEFRTVYNLDVIEIPTHRPIARKDQNDMIFRTEAGKLKAIARKVKELHEKGQPVLIGTASIEKNELLSDYLTRMGIVHEMLNAKNHEREGEIIAQAGQKGRVTIATNMAGRGVDIKLGGNPATEEEYEEVKRIGGLFVLGTERHEARRIDNQLRGRAGRQGDPGETQFFVSIEDSLMRVFAGDLIKNTMARMNVPEDEPIQSSLITKSLETAQTRIEGYHFDSRKHVLAFDDVLNHQRAAIYKLRNRILHGDTAQLEDLVKEKMENGAAAEELFSEKRAALAANYEESLRRLLLQTIDMFWVEHLEVMDYIRGSVNLRAYGQRDPLIEYRKEGLRLFKELEMSIDSHIASMIPALGGQAVQAGIREMQRVQSQAVLAGGSEGGVRPNMPIVKTKEYGRNDLVMITNGVETKEVKYKKAERMVTEGGWKIV